MKPAQQKVVTAQDVQSSFYYVHVDSVEDYELLNTEDIGDDQLRGHIPGTHALLSSEGNVRRKPLPQNFDLALNDRPEPSPRIHAQIQAHKDGPHGSTQVARKPVRRGGPEHGNPDKAPPLPERRLLGPRPMRQRFLSVDGAALRTVPDRKNLDMRRWTEQPTLTPPQLPPRPSSIRQNNFYESTQNDELMTLEGQGSQIKVESFMDHCWDWEKKWEQKRLSDEVARHTSSQHRHSDSCDVFPNASLTLIRRYNGEQLNAGRILNACKDSILKKPADASVEMSVEILTPGYSKFCDLTTPQNDRNIESSCEAPLITSRGDYTFSKDGEEKAIFRRQLQLHGNGRRRTEGRKPESDDSSFTKGTRSSFDSRTHSLQSCTGYAPSAIGSSEHKISSSRAYHFESPWSGVCKFSTGIAGRSLKCKHSYPSTKTTCGPEMHSSTISELRFNLPSSQAIGIPTAKSPVPGAPREGKRSSIFSRHQSRGSSTSFGVNETSESGYFGSKVELEDRLDLSLGQEHAGGGFGGKQAKLGKLIIENEGLQMLDLIVAANMALWWKVYEKFT